jgi:hypothetical protein
MGFDNLANYYKTNFNLMQHHKYSLHELENMIPFEREVYITILAQHIDEQNQKIKSEQAKQRKR